MSNATIIFFTNPLYYDFNLYHCVPAVLYSITEQKQKYIEISSKIERTSYTDSDEKVTVLPIIRH